MSFWSGIYDAAVDEVLDAVPGGSLIGSVLGGTDGREPVRCPDQPSDDAVAYALARAPESVKTRGRTLFRAAGLESKFTTPYSIAYESVGGNNCNPDASSKSRAMRDWFLSELMAQYGQSGPDVAYEGNYSQSFDGSGAADPARTVPIVSDSFVATRSGSTPTWVLIAGIVGLVLIGWAVIRAR